MPRVCIKYREWKKAKLAHNYQLKRQLLSRARHQSINYLQQLDVLTELEKLPRNSSKSRQINRCNITHTSRAYNRLTGLSRYQIRDLGHQSLIPGLFKVSW